MLLQEVRRPIELRIVACQQHFRKDLRRVFPRCLYPNERLLHPPDHPILIDQEGGRVQRFRQGFTELPALGSLSSYYEGSLQRAASIVRDCGWVMATEMKTIGVDVSFSPVLDTFSRKIEINGNRAFHSDPDFSPKDASQLPKQLAR